MTAHQTKSIPDDVVAAACELLTSLSHAKLTSFIEEIGLPAIPSTGRSLLDRTSVLSAAALATRSKGGNASSVIELIVFKARSLYEAGLTGRASPRAIATFVEWLKRSEQPVKADVSSPIATDKATRHKARWMTLISALGLTIAFISWTSPYLCSDCYLASPANLGTSFASNTGMAGDIVASRLAEADSMIRPADLDQAVEFGPDGRSRSLQWRATHAGDPTWDVRGSPSVRLPNSSEFRHGQIRYGISVDYTIPVLNLKMRDVFAFLGTIVGVKPSEVTASFQCDASCSAESMGATVRLGAPANTTIEVKGSEMLDYYAAGEQSTFLRSGDRSGQPNSDAFIRFTAFKIKSVLDPCAYYTLLSSRRPDLFNPFDENKSIVLQLPTGPYHVTNCAYSLMLMKAMQNGRFGSAAEIQSIYSMALPEQQAPGYHQASMISLFVDWKRGETDLSTELLWLDEQICKMDNVRLNQIGLLHRYILIELKQISERSSAHCPLIKD
ncbi:hypothetical protein GOL88_28750 [Sinorhizobium medicae]|nr:hypothetical protein [Sinorhizobium medicae]